MAAAWALVSSSTGSRPANHANLAPFARQVSMSINLAPDRNGTGGFAPFDFSRAFISLPARALPARRLPMPRKVLLLCGVLSPLLYAMADAVAGLRWNAYSFRDQTISELGAIGAPSRFLFSTLLIVVYLLLVAFGLGVWRSADGRRPIRAVGALLIAMGLLALTAGQFVPMRVRGTEQGLTGTLHLVEGAVAMVIVLAAMGFAAAALGRRFRLYTIVTIALMLIFGRWSALDAPRVEAGLATPWLGFKERIFWYAYQLWFAVLALTLLGERAAERRHIEAGRGLK